MAKSALAAKPKRKPAPRQPKFMDERYTGGEPTWVGVDKWSDDKVRQEIYRGFYFYNYYMTASDMRKYVLEYGQKVLKWSKTDVAAFNECEDARVGITIGSYSKMVLNGAPIPASDFVTDKIAELLAYGNAKLAEKVDAEKSVAKRTIQDHMNEKFCDIVGEIEAQYDVMWSGSEEKFDFVAYFREVSMPQQFVNRIRDRYQGQLDELNESQAKKCDPQLAEAYAWMKKPDVKRITAWYASLFDALTTYGKVKAAVRKVRKVRPVSKEKQVKGVKYLKDFAELNLVSINPVDIIGSKELWVYNTKTRKLGQYVAAADTTQMTIKGSTIIGFDTKLSVAKTLRKPKEQLKAFQNAGKIALRKFMGDIRATEIALTGRINGDTVLLKTVR